MLIHIHLHGTSRASGIVTHFRGASGVAYKFVWDPNRCKHVLEGGPLTVEAFNKVAPDLFGAMEGFYRPVPILERELEDKVEENPLGAIVANVVKPAFPKKRDKTPLPNARFAGPKKEGVPR